MMRPLCFNGPCRGSRGLSVQYRPIWHVPPAKRKRTTTACESCGCNSCTAMPWTISDQIRLSPGAHCPSYFIMAIGRGAALS
eukprot:364234-Chlamydomonas_euryale.AAC.10